MTPTLRLSKLLFVLVLLLTSCQKDDGISNDGNQNENTPDTFSEYFGNEISRDFLGSVIDKDHNPIEGVSISIGSETAVTDSNGVFIIRDATVNERFGYIKAEKAGYIHGSRSVVPSNGTNKVTIILLEETVVGTVSSGSSSTVTATDGSSVSFDGNFVKEDGTAYTGSVNVIMHHLDPTDEDMEDQMPGMLYAQNEDGAERMLQTLGMLAVELRGSGGEDLNLAEGATSEIKIPVDASLLSTAPATIPLWYFDEATGYWKEEGQATLQGNMYVGTVSHFSFWNCDIQAEAVMLCVTVVDEDGKELNNIKVGITSTNYGTTYGYTNALGEVCGLVSSNETLTLKIFSYAICGDASLYTETIGPFNTDSNITVIINDNPNIIEETVIGVFNDCDGNPITEGYVQITYGGTTFIDEVNTDGAFEIVILSCLGENTFSITGSDFNNLQTTGNINYTFTSPLTDIISIMACDAVEEFMTYSVDDNAIYKLYTDIDELQFYPFAESFVVLNGTTGNLYDSLIIYIPNQLGSYSNDNDTYVTDLHLYFEENGQTFTYTMDTSEQGNVTINVTKIAENIGDFIDVNFSGEFYTAQGDTRTVVGSAHIRKDE